MYSYSVIMEKQECFLCKKDCDVEIMRKWKGNSGNIFDVCTRCYWAQKCKSYCIHCCQIYKYVKPHYKSYKHQHNRMLNDPVTLTPDENIEFQNRVKSNMDRDQRKLLALNISQ